MSETMEKLSELLKHVTCDDMCELYHKAVSGNVSRNMIVMFRLLGGISNKSDFTEVNRVRLSGREVTDLKSRGFGVEDDKTKPGYYHVFVDVDEPHQLANLGHQETFELETPGSADVEDRSWKDKIPEKYHDKVFLCADDVREILRIGINSTYELLHDAPFRTIKVGNLIRVPSAAFWNWYFENCE